MSACRVYWGSHGCMLERGHDGEHICDCSFDVDGNLRPHRDAPGADTGNVGRAPYYGPQTVFYGEDTLDAPQLVVAGQQWDAPHP